MDNTKTINGKRYRLSKEIEGNNCTYVFAQPIEETTQEEITGFYSSIADIYYNKIKKELTT